MTNPKKYLWGAGTALALLLVLGTCAQASTLEEVASSTHKLYFGQTAVCSVVAVSETEFVTAAHCVENSNPEMFSVRFGWTNYGLDIVAVNRDDDVAYLKFKPQDFIIENRFFVDIADEWSPRFGERVYTVGYPRAEDLTITEGLFTGKVSIEHLFGLTGMFYKTTIPITGGSSGGGMYKTTILEDGSLDFELVGLATANYRDVSFQSYFSVLESVKEILKNG